MVSTPRAMGPTDRRWAEKAEELEFSAVDRVKAAADKWATSLTTLTGLFSIVALIKGPEDISKLTLPYKWGAAIALVVALSCAFKAVYDAAIAAQGVPAESWNTGPVVRRESARAAREATQRLRSSRLWIIPAMAGLAVAIGLTWFGDRVEDPEKTVSAIVVRQPGGSVLCGQLTSDDSGNLLLVAPDKKTIPVANVVSLKVVQECP